MHTNLAWLQKWLKIFVWVIPKRPIGLILYHGEDWTCLLCSSSAERVDFLVPQKKKKKNQHKNILLYKKLLSLMFIGWNIVLKFTITLGQLDYFSIFKEREKIKEKLFLLIFVLFFYYTVEIRYYYAKKSNIIFFYIPNYHRVNNKIIFYYTFNIF